jgi:hypothetical protein
MRNDRPQFRADVPPPGDVRLAGAHPIAHGVLAEVQVVQAEMGGPFEDGAGALAHRVLKQVDRFQARQSCRLREGGGAVVGDPVVAKDKLAQSGEKCLFRQRAQFGVADRQPGEVQLLQRGQSPRVRGVEHLTAGPLRQSRGGDQSAAKGNFL